MHDIIMTPIIENYIKQLKVFYPTFQSTDNFLEVLHWCEQNNIETLKGELLKYWDETKNTVNEELLRYLKWSRQKWPEVAGDTILDDGVYFIRSIYPAIEIFKKHNPDLYVDIQSMYILECVGNRNQNGDETNICRGICYPSFFLEHYAQIKKYLKEWKSPVTRERLQFLYYIARRYHMLNPAAAFLKQREITQKIWPYLEIDKEKPSYTFELNKRISLYLWAAKQYSHISPEDIVKWAHETCAKGYYLQLKEEFYSELPIRTISLCLMLDGSGQIHVTSPTVLIFPYIYSLFKIQDSYEGDSNTVMVNFDLRKETAEAIWDKMNSIFDMLQYPVKPEDAKQFINIKEKIFRGVSDFIGFYFYGTPGPAYESSLNKQQRRRVGSFTDVQIEMHKIVAGLDFNDLQKKLSEGLDPNFTIRDLSLVDKTLGYVRDYNFYTYHGELEENNFAKIKKVTSVIRDFPIFILAKSNGDYKLYWLDKEGKPDYKDIQDKDAITFFNTLNKEEYFKGDRVLIDATHKRDGYRILSHLRSTLKGTYWEKQREEVARMHIAMLSLLLSYGARLDHRRHGIYSTLEFLIVKGDDYFKNDPTNHYLALGYLQAMLPFDGTSNLIVHPDSKHPFAHMIRSFHYTKATEKHVTPSIKGMVPQDDSLKIIHNIKTDDYLSLQSLPLKLLAHDKDTMAEVLALCKECFPDVLQRLEEAAFIKMFTDELTSYCGKRSGIYLLRDGSKQLVGFNIVDVDVDEQDSESPVLLQFRLTVTQRDISKTWTHLTALLVFQIMFHFEDEYENREIIGVFEAVAPLSYLLVAYLHCYPKYKCMSEAILARICRVFFTVGTVKKLDDRYYVKSPFFYEVKSAVEKIQETKERVPFRLSDMHCYVFNQNVLKGYSQMVAFSFNRHGNREAICRHLKDVMTDLEVVDVPQRARVVNSLCFRPSFGSM